MDTGAARDPRAQSDCSIACLRRRAWAQSKDSIWQESKPQDCDPQDSQQSQRDGDAKRPSEEPGRVPNKITSWLSECRTPLGASLDDQNASPSRGALRNGCSFEDDLSLGAEANHLQSSNKKTDSCFGLVAEQKRSQYKEKGRSMNSTGSGKSSTVSSVSELLDMYEEDPEEILLNLGFGREEPDLGSKVPSRFFNSSSLARGIDIKVYLGAQMQRMELENPNYALTSRFRQIEVLTTVANEFFQLYSQVSGQPVQRISSREQGGDGGQRGPDEAHPAPKRSNSALNVAKLLKKTITKHNLLAAAAESPDANTPKQHAQLSGQTPSNHTHTNGHAHAGPEQDCSSTDPDHQVETVSQKHIRKKDSCSLATVTEETNGDGETDWLPNNSPEQSSTEQAANGEHKKEATDLPSTSQTTEEASQVVKEEKSLTSTPVKAPHTLAPPQLAQLRTENADSFDMEEIQSNDDEGLNSRTFRGTDLLRTVSQQSDSSGFAEEPSADSNSYLKVQESSDSCDSETTVTSHPSQDVATPLAVEQPVFELPDFKEEESEPGGTGEVDGRSSSREEDEHDGSSEQIPQYTAHYFLGNKPMVMQLDETQEEEEEEEPTVEGDLTNPQPETESESQAEPNPEPEISPNVSTIKQKPQDTENQSETVANTETPTESEKAEDQIQEHVSLDPFDVSCLPAPSSPVLSALNRAKQTSKIRAGVQVSPNSNSSDTPQSSGGGRGRRMCMQRSSSLPSSLLSPSRVVSSVRIQFGQGHTSCTQPRYSFRYSPEAEDDREDEVEGQANHLSTLIVKPASNNQFEKPPTDASIPPKPIPRYLLRSSCSLRSSSPPDWSPGSHTQFWNTQSIPDVSNQQPPGHFQQNSSPNLNQQSWNSGQVFSHPNPNPAAPNVNHSPNTSPSPYPFALNPLYPSNLQPYASLPNLHHHYGHSLNHHSSLTSLHHPATPTIPHHSSLSNLHQPPASIAPHHFSADNMHSRTPVMQHPGYNNTYSHPSPYHATPHSSQFSSPYLGYHGYNANPHLGFPQTIPQYPLFPPQHGLHPGLAPPAPGFLPDLAPSFGQGQSHYPGFASPAASGSVSSHGPSSTEMQLRRVLHDIRGTVQSLSQYRANTPDMFREDLSIHQFLSELHQKRHSLNLFRSQMMDLELSIMQQQALVFKHLSPTDRLEVEHLQSLRSAVREELQELEQQLEHRLTPHRVLPRGSSVDSLSATSALKAMEPVSDLLKEQLFLQSELSDDGHTISTNPSSRSSSPVLGIGEQNQGVYRTSINITPVPPPRPNINIEEEAEEEGERDGDVRDGDIPKAEGAAGGVRAENLQQLIREIRESVAQEVRQEIYDELLAAVSPHQSSLSARQHPL